MGLVVLIKNNQKMRFLILLLLSFSTFTSIKSTKIPVHPRADTNDFLVQLILTISESKVPDYLTDVIYNRPSEKGVLTENVIELLEIESLHINTTLEILEALDISSSNVFSLNGLNHTLEALHWSFTAFYNSVTTNLALSGTPLRDALLALQIDVTSFSSGITWGDPDPWSEFIKGTFTQASIEQACEAAGITIETLFDGIRDLIVADIVNWEIEEFVQLSLNHSIGQPEAVIIWNVLNITMEGVNNVELFRDILAGFRDRINSQPSLGILPNINSIYVNKRSYDLFENESELVDVHAETVLTKRVLTVDNINNTIYQNIVVFNFESDDEDLTTVEVGYVDHNLTECNYITMRNNALVSSIVEEAIFSDETFIIPRATVGGVILGSILVCNNTVYGLAREVVGDTIVFDVFEDYVDPDDPSSATRIWNLWYQNTCLIVAAYAFAQIFRN